jgi:hypothetical protein
VQGTFAVDGIETPNTWFLQTQVQENSSIAMLEPKAARPSNIASVNEAR